MKMMRARGTRRVLTALLKAKSRKTDVVIGDEVRRTRAMGHSSKKTSSSGFQSKTEKSIFERWLKTRQKFPCKLHKSRVFLSWTAAQTLVQHHK